MFTLVFMDDFFDDYDNIDDDEYDGYNRLDIHAIVREMPKRRHVAYSIENGTAQLSYLLQDFDSEKEYHFLSNGGGFASINFINYVHKNFGRIKRLYVSTLRVGKKQIEDLARMRIDSAVFVFSGVFDQGEDLDYNYFDAFQEICKDRGWNYYRLNNHSKIILMQTDEHFFVLETSSNLNENPKIEQFTFCDDAGLFDFYQKFFEAAKKQSV